MTTLREAAQFALDALHCPGDSELRERVEAKLRDALAEPDEPVAWGMPRKDGLILDVICPEEHARCEGAYTVPLYAAPQPRRQPLTDEEILKLAYPLRHEELTEREADTAVYFARAVEAAIWSKS